MKIFKTAIILALVAASSVIADDSDLNISVGVEARSGPTGGPPLVFASDPVPVHVELRIAPDARTSEFTLPSWEWEMNVTYEIVDVDGHTRRIPVSQARVTHRYIDGGDPRNNQDPIVRKHQIREASVELPPLPAGTYTVRARLTLPGLEIASGTDEFLVRNGDEDRDLQVEKLQRTAEKIRSTPPRCDSRECRAEWWNAYRDVMLKVAEMEPMNAGAWELLGDVSLGDTPPEETLHYYERARQVAAQRLERLFGGVKEASVEHYEAWLRYDRELTLYARRVYPYVLEHPHAPVITYHANRTLEKIFVAYPSKNERIEFRDEGPPRERQIPPR